MHADSESSTATVDSREGGMNGWGREQGWRLGVYVTFKRGLGLIRLVLKSSTTYNGKLARSYRQHQQTTKTQH